MNLIRGSVASQMGCDLYGIRPEHLELSIEKVFGKGVYAMLNTWDPILWCT